MSAPRRPDAQQVVTAAPGSTVEPADPWAYLRRHTPARIALGRAGGSMPLAEVLRFWAAHAQTRDAVHVSPDEPALVVRSRVTDRFTYLRRPHLGWRLAQALTTAVGGRRCAVRVRQTARCAPPR